TPPSPSPRSAPRMVATLGRCRPTPPPRRQLPLERRWFGARCKGGRASPREPGEGVDFSQFGLVCLVFISGGDRLVCLTGPRRFPPPHHATSFGIFFG